MEMLNRFNPVLLFLVVVGALNWGILGVTGTNVLAEIFGTGTVTDVIYAVIGIAGILYLPKLFEAMRLGTGPHPRGT